MRKKTQLINCRLTKGGLHCGSMNWETLACLGDSITIGARSYLGYPEYTGAFLEEETDKSWNVINEAVSGITTIELARRVSLHFGQLKAHLPNILTLLIGTNDLKCETSVGDFQIAYGQLVTKVQLIVGSPNIILILIPKLVPGVMLPYRLEMNERVATYNEVIRQLAVRHKLEVFEFDSSEEDFYDGVHLNSLGSQKWGKQLSNFILDLRR